MYQDNNDAYVMVVSGDPATLPPKDGLIIAAFLKSRGHAHFIFWDSAVGGGRGGWFNVKNQAVPESDICSWERRDGKTDNRWIVKSLNKIKLTEAVASGAIVLETVPSK